jgi:hypothetical protein
MVIEYVVRQNKGPVENRMGKYEILSVRPLTLEGIRPSDEKVIEVDFDRSVVLDDLVNGYADRFYVCALYDKQGGSVIHPNSVIQERHDKTLRLDFDFSKTTPAPFGRCFTLKCSTEDTKDSEMIRHMEEETSFCFMSNSEL